MTREWRRSHLAIRLGKAARLLREGRMWRYALPSPQKSVIRDTTAKKIYGSCLEHGPEWVAGFRYLFGTWCRSGHRAQRGKQARQGRLHTGREPQRREGGRLRRPRQPAHRRKICLEGR